MFARLILISALSGAVLSACATPQENPYYKYSSQYKGAPVTVAEAGTVFETAPVSYEAVSYETVQSPTYTRVNHECLKKEKNHELLGGAVGGTIGAVVGKELIGGTKGTIIGAGLGGAAGYGIGDKSVTCDPQPVVTTQTAPIVSQAYVSPTDTGFAPLSDQGTPGYQVLQGQTVEMFETPSALPSTQTVAIPQAQEVDYDYTANTIAVSANNFAVPSETQIIGGGTFGSHIVKQGDTVYSLSRQLCVDLGDIRSLNNLDASYGISIGQTLRLPAPRC